MTMELPADYAHHILGVWTTASTFSVEPQSSATNYLTMPYQNQNNPPATFPFKAQRAYEFNEVMRTLPCVEFTEVKGSGVVYFFRPENSIYDRSTKKNEARNIYHTIFIGDEDKAAQLELKESLDPTTTYFTSSCRGIDGEFSLRFERDFNVLTVTDHSSRIRHFLANPSSFRPASTTVFHSLPPLAQTLLFEERLGFVCLTLSPFGSYPKDSLSLREVRGFRSTETRDGYHVWEEFKTGSTRWMNPQNLYCNTELGDFFIPGPASAGHAYFHAAGGTPVVLKMWEPLHDLFTPDAPMFEPVAFKALRDLGLPVAWPPSEFLYPT